MPLYDYQCRNCGAEFEALRGVHDDDNELECPFCHEKDCERRVSLTASDFLAAGRCGGSRSSHRFG